MDKEKKEKKKVETLGLIDKRIMALENLLKFREEEFLAAKAELQEDIDSLNLQKEALTKLK